MRLWRRTCRSSRYAGYKTPTWCCEWTTGTIGSRTTLWPSGCEIRSSRTDVNALPASVFRIYRSLSPQTTPMKYRHRALALLAALSVITYLDRVCISVAGPRIQNELHLRSAAQNERGRRSRRLALAASVRGTPG